MYIFFSLQEDGLEPKSILTFYIQYISKILSVAGSFTKTRMQWWKNCRFYILILLIQISAAGLIFRETPIRYARKATYTFF